MSDEDLFYLEDKELARQLIEVGYHGKGKLKLNNINEIR